MSRLKFIEPPFLGCGMQFQPQLALHTDDHADRVQNNVTDISAVTTLDGFLTVIRLQQRLRII
jgi:hypothetical protein